VLVLGTCHLAHRDVAGGAGLVVDVDALAQDLGQLAGNGAGDDLAAAAGRERHDEADGLARPGGLGARDMRQTAGHGGRSGGETQRRAPGDGGLLHGVAAVG
jgi:hypothetical protein